MNNIILCLMLLSYSIPITLSIYHYDNNKSVSNLIHNNNTKKLILISMILMGGFTLLYEYYAN